MLFALVNRAGELKDTPQPEDELKPRLPGTTQGVATAASGAHDAEVEGSTPSPATTPGTAPVADVQPVESPGEKWWREFQEGLNK